MSIAAKMAPSQAGKRSPFPNAQFMDVTVLRDHWKQLFDPSSSHGDRQGIIDGMRGFVENGLIIKPGSATSQMYYLGYVDIDQHGSLMGLQKIPESTVVVGVMARGFNNAGYYYSQFNEIGLSDGGLRLMGFSSGMYKHGDSKLFSDGTNMYGKVFVLSEDLEAIMKGRSVTFVDHCPPNTRATLVALGRALIQQGYSNPIFELDNNGYVKEWNNYVIRDPTVQLPKKIPIMTEHGRKDSKLLISAKRAARE